MKPYFEKEERKTRLTEALEKREGIPFRFGKGKIEGGLDCWHLVLEVYADAGLNTEALEEFPTGSLNWGKFHSESRILNFLHSDPECRRRIKRIESDEPTKAGDLLAIRQGMSANHLAIAQDEVTAWHVPRGGSVSRMPIKAFRTAGLLHAIFRIYE